MIKGLKKIALIGGLTLAGTFFYSGERIENYFNLNETNKLAGVIESPLTTAYFTLISDNYIKSLGNPTSFEKAKKQYEEYKKSELEKIIKKERKIRKEEEFKKPFYLTEDSLNTVIKQAYEKMKKEGKRWPKEFDKRLFRLMLKQESRYDVHAVSRTGHMGLGQSGFGLVETLRQDKWNNEFKNSITGEIRKNSS